MLRTLILNDIKNYLLNLRFVISLLFILIIFSGGSIIFCKKYLNEKEKDNENARWYKNSLDSGKDGLETLYTMGFVLAKQQEITSFFSIGDEGRFPKGFVFSPSAPWASSSVSGMFSGSVVKNYKLDNYTDFDLVFIVGIVLSFLTIVLSFDAISRDREEGTLRQRLSNSVPRVKILFGKYITLLLLLLIALIIGFLINIIIFQFVIGQNVFTSFEIETLLTTSLVAIYISIFIWIGLWISSSVKKSSTALALLLLIWITTVVLSPYIGGMIARRFYPVTSEEEHYEKLRNLIGNQKAPSGLTDLFYGRESEEAWREVQKFYERRDNDDEQLFVDRFMELTNQAKKAQSWNFFSPFGAFKQAMEHITNTGLDYHTQFFYSVRRYCYELIQFIRERDKLDPQSRHRVISFEKIRSMSQKPVDPAIIPKFHPPSRRLSLTNIQEMVSPIGYLLGLNVIFFLLALSRFLKMDVR